MKLKSISTLVSMLVLAALVVLLPGAGGAVAQGPAPTGGTISYSGHLSNDAGQPVVDGMYAFTFALYDAANDGNLLWSEAQADATVKSGAFTALLGSVTPLPKEARIGKGWLAVSVRGPGEADFTALAPRQLLNTVAPASPASPAGGGGLTCAHTHFGEWWTGDSTGTTGLAGINIQDTKSDGRGIVGLANTGTNAAGVYGSSISGYGVVGASDTGSAMAAIGNAQQTRGSGGWVKAMARVSGTSVTRCYNSQVNPATTSAPCGFTSTDSSGTYTVNFGFQVNDRFISITPEWGSAGTPAAVVDSFPTANSVKVRLAADSAFYIIVY